MAHLVAVASYHNTTLAQAISHDDSQQTTPAEAGYYLSRQTQATGAFLLHCSVYINGHRPT